MSFPTISSNQSFVIHSYLLLLRSFFRYKSIRSLPLPQLLLHGSEYYGSPFAPQNFTNNSLVLPRVCYPTMKYLEVHYQILTESACQPRIGLVSKSTELPIPINEIHRVLCADPAQVPGEVFYQETGLALWDNLNFSGAMLILLRNSFL